MDFKNSRYGRFMNGRVPSSRRYEPTDYEHAANCATHGLWIIPSLVGGSVLYFLSVDQWQAAAAWLYGAGLSGLFISSTLFHTVAWKIRHLRVEQRFHMCDRMAIYFFIAASYTPWLMLRELGPRSCVSRLMLRELGPWSRVSRLMLRELGPRSCVSRLMMRELGPRSCVSRLMLRELGPRSCVSRLMLRELGPWSRVSRLMPRELGPWSRVSRLMLRELGPRSRVSRLMLRELGPWSRVSRLMLRELGPWSSHMRWIIWIMAVIGSTYVFYFHERYKLLELLGYVVMGAGPALVILSMVTHTHTIDCPETFT
ncbi:monocyte to macrophage differentiation factor 2-like isoform X3 [Oncorhynchus clarkii lewisi]|uniref:monocyte to macrophage differentiation factor 2-like isoform X3 n=1 Tax=Oncorhynchus clarkii lewisi TaxID=490388 RepID=UPI0039B9C5F0